MDGQRGGPTLSDLLAVGDEQDGPGLGRGEGPRAQDHGPLSEPLVESAHRDARLRRCARNGGEARVSEVGHAGGVGARDQRPRVSVPRLGHRPARSPALVLQNAVNWCSPSIRAFRGSRFQ